MLSESSGDGSDDAPGTRHETHARYRALFELSPSLSVSLDVHGIIHRVNAHGAAELGYDPSELVAGSLLQVVDERDRTELGDQIEMALGRPDTVVSWDLRLSRKDGSTLWTRSSLRSMPQSEKGHELLFVCKDVTEHKTTEERLLEYHERLRILTSELVLAEEEERRRIATHLHDDVGHSLALAQIRLGQMNREGTNDLRRDLAPVRELIAEAIENTRSLTFDLSSPVLYELGLSPALESIADRLSAATGVRIEFISKGEQRPLSQDRRVLLFRSTRELLLNVAKHSGARSASVGVRTAGDELRIEVADDGVGFDVKEVMRPGGRGMGHGLLSAVEQVRAIGGRIEVDSAPGRGTRCVIVAPLESGDG